jgi:hypothetical protein
MSRTEAILSLSFFVAAVTLHADVVLPTTGFNGGANCFENAVQQLPALNGIEGVELQVGCNSTGTALAQFQFGVNGPLTGGSLPKGTVIPFTFSFSATSLNAGITSITGASVAASGNLHITSLQEQTLMNGPCTPFTNTCWVLAEIGSGTTITGPSDIASGSLMQLGLQIGIGTTNTLGTPTIGLTSTVDFNANPVPEPPHGTLVLLAVGLVYVAFKKLRTAI